MYIHTQHSTGPACPLPAVTQVPAHVPARSPCHINANCPHVPLSQQLPYRNCHHPDRLLGQEAMWHLPDPDAITSTLLRAKPWQLPKAGASSHRPQPAQPVPTPEAPSEGR